MKFEFPAPTGSYRKVKTIKPYITNSEGRRESTNVTVWLQTAGTPQFTIGLPTNVFDIWTHHHEHDRYGHSFAVNAIRGFLSVSAATFDQCEKGFIEVMACYESYLKTRSKEKVIGLRLSLVKPGLSHNPATFNENRICVGMTSGVYWRVNGELYSDGRGDAWWNNEDEPPKENPDFDELSYARDGRSMVVIPYTDAALATVKGIEVTLVNAIDMLAKLLDKDQTSALLNGGMTMLAAPKMGAAIAVKRRTPPKGKQ